MTIFTTQCLPSLQLTSLILAGQREALHLRAYGRKIQTTLAGKTLSCSVFTQSKTLQPTRTHSPGQSCSPDKAPPWDGCQDLLACCFQPEALHIWHRSHGRSDGNPSDATIANPTGAWHHLRCANILPRLQVGYI
jgi:hypothetical protein